MCDVGLSSNGITADKRGKDSCQCRNEMENGWQWMLPAVVFLREKQTISDGRVRRRASLCRGNLHGSDCRGSHGQRVRAANQKSRGVVAVRRACIRVVVIVAVRTFRRGDVADVTRADADANANRYLSLCVTYCQQENSH